MCLITCRDVDFLLHIMSMYNSNTCTYKIVVRGCEIFSYTSDIDFMLMYALIRSSCLCIYISAGTINRLINRFSCQI